MQGVWKKGHLGKVCRTKNKFGQVQEVDDTCVNIQEFILCVDDCDVRILKSQCNRSSLECSANK